MHENNRALQAIVVYGKGGDESERLMQRKEIGGYKSCLRDSVLVAESKVAVVERGDAAGVAEHWGKS